MSERFDKTVAQWITAASFCAPPPFLVAVVEWCVGKARESRVAVVAGVSLPCEGNGRGALRRGGESTPRRV